MKSDRQRLSINIDSRLYQIVKSLAAQQGTSINRWLEDLLFAQFQQSGLLPKNSPRIPESRGGDFRSAKYQQSLIAKSQGE